MSKLKRLQQQVLPILALGLLLLLVLWTVLAPAESRLGNVIKVVYVHGALVWAGLLTFSLAGVLGAVALAVRYLVRSAGRAAVWYRGTQAAALAALIVWIVYVISSMVVTGMAWGQLIAWNEPRVRVTALILAAALLLAFVARLVNHPDFTAGVNLAMGIVPWVMVQQVEAIRHPVDPIGGSESASIQLYYLLILLTVVALAMTLVAWLWVKAERKAISLRDHSGMPLHTGGPSRSPTQEEGP
jgi:hypothetical protein